MVGIFEKFQGRDFTHDALGGNSMRGSVVGQWSVNRKSKPGIRFLRVKTQFGPASSVIDSGD
jgi:hypothetical protein